MVHADGSAVQTFDYLTQNGLQGLVDIWPRPTAMAWKIIACYAAFEALHQLALPGKRVEGPISPAGNVPVYKANGMLAYAVTLVTYIGLWWFGIFNPAIVYDYLGEIYSAVIFGSLFFCVLLYKRSCCSIFYQLWIIWESFQDNISLYFSYSGLSFTESDHLVHFTLIWSEVYKFIHAKGLLLVKLFRIQLYFL
ncbi:hypothetical protein MKW92_019881 [Papaver armeniacum]|nr:hypothetical protein MKW92_019881 [Papaver armeniacum]